MQPIKVYKNDKLYDINFTLKDADDNPIDLTGATILFKAQREGESALKFSGNMSIVNATNGQCKYTVQDGDFDKVGTYYCEIEVTFSGGKVITFGDIIVEVKPELPRS